jgi:hypothetical protein
LLLLAALLGEQFFAYLISYHPVVGSKS